MGPRNRPGGTVIYLADEKAAAVWFVKRGVVALAAENSESGTRLTHVRRPGQLLGVESLVRGHYAHTARAVSDVTLCSVSQEHFERWIQEGDAARAVLHLVLLAQESDRQQQPEPGSAVERTARWILRGAEQEVPLQRRQIAQLLQMAPETFSRSLALLASEGSIVVTRTQVRIVDRALLEATAYRTRETESNYSEAE